MWNDYPTRYQSRPSGHSLATGETDVERETHALSEQAIGALVSNRRHRCGTRNSRAIRAGNAEERSHHLPSIWNAELSRLHGKQQRNALETSADHEEPLTVEHAVILLQPLHGLH